MRTIRILTLALVCVASLYGQRRFNGQDACFMHPTAPYCLGHEDAIKRVPPAKGAVPQPVVTNPAARPIRRMLLLQSALKYHL
jgi:hypothetical protein